ncbi:hypothetical protein FRC12_006700, partial [Ceratobasidium sp. 428]
MHRRARPVGRLTQDQIAEYEANEAAGPAADFFGLNAFERIWTTYYDYLYGRGYQLRQRYRPGWVPSWRGTDRNPEDCEDSWMRRTKLLVDAVRISDRKQAMIKKMVPSSKMSGAEIHRQVATLQSLSSPERRRDPRNHSEEYLDSFPVPDVQGGLFVVTVLYVGWDRPMFETTDEATDFIRQALEGLTFLHENRIAHRDPAPQNIGMDPRPMMDGPFHPIRNEYSLDGDFFIDARRPRGPVRYYYIEFDNSALLNGDSSTSGVGVTTRILAPELSHRVPYDLFKANVFILGSFLEQEFRQKFRNFSFL